MGSISSDDCKAFLETNFHYPAKEWKRVSKQKDASGTILREFTHPTAGSVVLAEASNGQIHLPASVVVPSSFSSASRPVPATLNAWDIVNKRFDAADVLSAQKLFDDAVDHASVTLDTSGRGYHAIPGLFMFAFMDEAGEHYNVIDAINETEDPDAIVAGLTVFIAPSHRDYGCNHLSWAVKPFLPWYFEEVEESSFALYEKWANVYDEKRQKAVDKGTIAQVRLMDVVRDLSNRGFRYNSEHCVFATLLEKGNTYLA